MLREPDQVWDVLRSQSEVSNYPTNKILHHLHFQTVTVTITMIVMVRTFVLTVNASGKVRCFLEVVYKLNVAKIMALIMILFQDATAKLIPIATQVIQVFIKKLPSLQNRRYARNAPSYMPSWVLMTIHNHCK